MAVISFPANFTLSLPVPLPGISTTLASYNIQVYFRSKIRFEGGPVKTLQFFPNIAILVSNVDSGSVVVEGTTFDWVATATSGFLTVSITADLDGWIFESLITVSNNIELDIYGDDIPTWNDETFNSTLTNSNSGLTVELNNTDGPAWMNPKWNSDLDSAHYLSYANPGFLSYEEAPPPPPPPPPSPPIPANLIIGNVIKLPCFIPCIPHAIKAD